jgi:hypothetical protein
MPRGAPAFVILLVAPGTMSVIRATAFQPQ